METQEQENGADDDDDDDADYEGLPTDNQMHDDMTSLTHGDVINSMMHMTS